LIKLEARELDRENLKVWNSMPKRLHRISKPIEILQYLVFLFRHKLSPNKAKVPKTKNHPCAIFKFHGNIKNIGAIVVNIYNAMSKGWARAHESPRLNL